MLQVLDPATLIWFRFLFSALALTVYVAWQQQMPNRWSAVPWGTLAIAVVFLSGNYWLFLLGVQATTPNNAQILIQLAPMLLGLFSLWWFKEKYSLWQWLGVGILILGLILFSHSQVLGLVTTLSTYLWGNTILIFGALSWAIYGIAQKQLLRHYVSPVVMWGLYTGATLLFTPFAHPQQLLSLSPFFWAILLFCAANTVVAYGSFAAALEHWEASRVSAVLVLVPLITLIASAVLPNFFPTLIPPEPLTLSGVIGALLVVLGSLLTALAKHNSRQPPLKPKPESSNQ
jgi:drug/metabolite transporter (DMT)-like permease